MRLLDFTEVLMASSLSRVEISSSEPGHVVAESMAQVDRRVANGRLGRFRPERELVAATAALVTVVASHGDIYRERCAMFRLGLVYRAESVPLISSPASALEAQQVEDLLHADLVAKSVEVDTRHA